MQISKQKVNPALDKQIKRMWFQLVVDIKNLDEAETILESMLSETEMVAITKRLAVAYWLSKKRRYEVIKQNLKVSSATIATLQQELRKSGWKLAMQKVTAEEWATQMEQKIKAFISRVKR